MPERSTSFSITHDELIKDYPEYHRAENNPNKENIPIRRRFQNKFLVAIAEGSAAGQLAYDILISLDELFDPESGRRICPQIHNKTLQQAIARATIQEKKFQAQAQGLASVSA